MARLLYVAICSLDGYVADAGGRFDWSAPSDEVHAFVNGLVRGVGTYLYGRRMYDVMVAWESDELLADPNPAIGEFAGIWRAADKIVYSRTLAEARGARTRIEREFDPDAIRRLKTEREHDLAVAGPELAAEALRANLVDEVHLLLSPITVGGGKRALPANLRIQLELRDLRRFENGVVYVRYDVPASGPDAASA